MLPAQKEKEKCIEKLIEEMSGMEDRLKFNYLREKNYRVVDIYKTFGTALKQRRPITLNRLKYWEKLRKKGLLKPTDVQIPAKKKKKPVKVKKEPSETTAKRLPIIRQPKDVVVIDPATGQPEHVMKFLKSRRKIPPEIVVVEKVGRRPPVGVTGNLHNYSTLVVKKE